MLPLYPYYGHQEIVITKDGFPLGWLPCLTRSKAELLLRALLLITHEKGCQCWK